MPEGPEVKIIVDDLNDALCGKTLEKITFTCGEDGGKYRDECPSDYDKFTSLLPLKLKHVKAKGKFYYFVFRLVDKSRRHVYLAGGLGMAGKYCFLEKQPKHTCMIMNFKGLLPLYFVDVRHFANIYFFLSDKDLECKLKDIGPDWLNDGLAVEDFIQIVKRHPRMTINNFLMNQKYVSGVGNYIKSEVLYRARISPHRKCENLSDKELKLLYNSIEKVMNGSYKYRGMSRQDYVDLEGNKGDYEKKLKVYGRKIDPLGNTIKAEIMGAGRTTYWVPKLQK